MTIVYTILLIVSFIALIYLVMKANQEDINQLHTCRGCQNEWRKDQLKHYDYEYNYEYRCSKCNTIVIDG